MPLRCSRARARSRASACPSAPATSSTATSPGIGAGHALRPARPRPLDPGARPSLQSGEAARRSLRARARPRLRLRPVAAARNRADGTPRRRATARRTCRKAMPSRRCRWPRRSRPRVPWRDTVVYELHVRGFTRAHPGIPAELRGTFAALAHPAAIAHLRAARRHRRRADAGRGLGRRARICAPLGLANYWGYNPIALLAPDPRLAPGGMAEVRQRGRRAAGGRHRGDPRRRASTTPARATSSGRRCRCAGSTTPPITACSRDDPRALRRRHRLRQHAGAATGRRCCASPWTRCATGRWPRGVDGFRFDLATTLGRRADGFDPAAPLLQAIAQDPVLRELKLIAEPWDIGPGGYQLGALPAAWGEWNDRYRDTVRRFWRGDRGRRRRARDAPRRLRRPLPRGARSRRRARQLRRRA